MNLFRWLKSKFEMAPLNRVAAVSCDDQTINFQWIGGSTSSSTWDQIQRVLIRTTDQGPFDDDVFLVIETADKNHVIPQPAPGASQLLGRLQQLPGFNNEAVIDSMGCTDNQQFLCWERGDAVNQPGPEQNDFATSYELDPVESNIEADTIFWSCPCGVPLQLEFHISKSGLGYPQTGVHDWVTGGVSVPCPECGRRFFLPSMADSPSVSEVIPNY